MSRHLNVKAVRPPAPAGPPARTLGQYVSEGDFLGRVFEVVNRGGQASIGLGVHVSGEIRLIDPTDGQSWFIDEDTTRSAVVIRQLNATITYEEVIP